MQISDPRIFFAAERTLLAWIRTGLTIMGFGFVVARFGLFLSLLATQHMPSTTPPASPSLLSSDIGIALVLLGAVSMIFSGIQHRRFILSLPDDDLPRLYNSATPVALALILGSLGLLLAIYLAV
jgi:putative membrane protein